MTREEKDAAIAQSRGAYRNWRQKQSRLALAKKALAHAQLMHDAAFVELLELLPLDVLAEIGAAIDAAEGQPEPPAPTAGAPRRRLACDGDPMLDGRDRWPDGNPFCAGDRRETEAL